VGYNLFKTVKNINMNLIILESQRLELFWTVVPTFILLLIGFPSIRLLYLIDEVQSPIITLKTLGHQWYWRYEYSDLSEKEFDSYITRNGEASNFQPRLLEVDNRVVLPFKTQVRNLVSSADVLHSWTVPALGVKVDAVPGRLNQLRFIMNRPGNYFGQCSEICGANHRFMPICLEAVSHKSFTSWALKD
jgi:cytochrome c oxidase subunit 2